jgi:uncharacterized membrane protein
MQTPGKWRSSAVLSGRILAKNQQVVFCMMQNKNSSPSNRELAFFREGILVRFSRNWLLVFSMIYGVYVFLPFLAPVFMEIGWEKPARLIYFMYSTVCHQLPQRSYFLFGANVTYPLNEIQSAWKMTLNPFELRQFIGSASMGWKVAWSDRMVSMYTSILLFAWIWWPLRRKINALPLWGLLLFMIPMAIDGTSHLVSDFSGLGQGFRDSNQWLAVLTSNYFPSVFYHGDGLGSFNSWMRLITGVLFGLGLVWFGFPHLEKYFNEIAHVVEKRNWSKEKISDYDPTDRSTPPTH